MAAEPNNLYKFQIGKMQKTVKSGENFQIRIVPATCETCKVLLVPGENFTIREFLPKMCDGCFKKFGDECMEKANGG